ncbi:nucleoside hydrolase [Amycolatopsis cynarae]|uniref:Nucleoside hydrolase n=1 Tax=Amycolatopsis cynarae TaxID=2995223 RepID=A0ABY7B985_9PSEU|nr:nucleoside hydrolase [Amycolatopsis sp. HUAS 11-8]WAL68223.1 nucleoside hydrolase [Amycolatopsis sp. HUAS 11-8]
MTVLPGAPAPVYLDCDTGIDDSLALAYLLAAPEVELVGIGTVSGNVTAAQGARNTLDLLALAGRSGIPVAVGAHDPLAGRYGGAVPHIHGRNGVGDVELPASGVDQIGEDAAEFLVRLAKEHDGALRVVAVGPLTNLARALELEPALPGLVSEVTIMGGAALVPGNVSAVAEANIANDPEAAAVVFAAPWDLTLVPLDVTLENTLEEEHRRVLLASADPFLTGLGRILDVYFDFYVDLYGRRSSALHDPLAAAIAAGGITPTIAPRVPVVIDATDGPGRGQTLCDLRGQRRGSVDRPGARCRVVLATDAPLAPHLLDRLLARWA